MPIALKNSPFIICPKPGIKNESSAGTPYF
jgi:hypothetical protein